MREAKQAIQEECNGFDGDLVAVGQMDPLERRVPLDEGVYRFVGDVRGLHRSARDLSLRLHARTHFD